MKFEEGDIITVTINGKDYATQIQNGVQRFVKQSAVNFLVEGITKSHSELYNSLAVAVLEGKVSLKDYIEFQTMHGGSLGWFEDSLGSLIDLNPHIFTAGSYEDYIKLENPLWED